MVDKCPICDEGFLVRKSGTNNITYKGVKGFVNFYYDKCNECGSEVASDWQLAVNKDNVLYFHRMVDGGWVR